jgi:hypothetical protein
MSGGGAMPGALVITAGSAADAECIARELAAFNPELAQTERTWRVSVEDTVRVVEVLGALESCLADNGISSVIVSVGGNTYVMEPAVYRATKR